MLIASSSATAKAQELQAAEDTRERERNAAGLGDEPPPLEGGAPPSHDDYAVMHLFVRVPDTLGPFACSARSTGDEPPPLEPAT